MTVSGFESLSPETEQLLAQRMAEYEANLNATRTTDEITAGILQLKKRIAESPG